MAKTKGRVRVSDDTGVHRVSVRGYARTVHQGHIEQGKPYITDGFIVMQVETKGSKVELWIEADQAENLATELTGAVATVRREPEQCSSYCGWGCQSIKKVD